VQILAKKKALLIFALPKRENVLEIYLIYAKVAQLVERNLAKVEVASSSLVFRSKIESYRLMPVTFLFYCSFARVVELVDTQDLKSCVL
jgi:hypothetical protein